MRCAFLRVTATSPWTNADISLDPAPQSTGEEIPKGAVRCCIEMQSKFYLLPSTAAGELRAVLAAVPPGTAFSLSELAGLDSLSVRRSVRGGV